VREIERYIEGLGGGINNIKYIYVCTHEEEEKLVLTKDKQSSLGGREE